MFYDTTDEVNDTDQNGELDPDMIAHFEERDCVLREIADRENDVFALRLDLASYGGGVPMLKRIARAEFRVEALHEELDELDHAWVRDYAFDCVAM